MINPLKELQKEHEKNKQVLNEHAAITETNRLLSEKGKEDYEMLRDMGMHHNLKAAIELQGKKIELEKIEDKYGKVFTKDEIKAIACKYALKFLKTEFYRGPVDAQLMQKMREFSADTGIELDTTTLGHRFYIMAPANLFQLQDQPKPPPPPPKPEPIVFYRIDPQGEYYRMIHQWGNDLSNWRRVMGWKYESGEQYSTYWFIIAFFITFFVANIFFYTWWMLLPAIVIGLITGVKILPTDSNFSLTWDKLWDNNLKPKT